MTNCAISGKPKPFVGEGCPAALVMECAGKRQYPLIEACKFVQVQAERGGNMLGSAAQG